MDDLFQEAMIYLWHLESSHPNQKPSWYLQGCKFHLQNKLKKGKSLDSHKRRAGAVNIEEEVYGSEKAYGFVMDDLSVNRANQKDVLTALEKSLPRITTQILEHLIVGYRVEEIARVFNLSPRTISKHRQSILSKAKELHLRDELVP